MDANDSHGHPAGDKLLKRVAQRLVSRVRETDFVARLGGDELAIVANNLKSANDAAAIAEMVKDALANSIELDGTDTFTKASFGITMFLEDSSDPDVLLKNADMRSITPRMRALAGSRSITPILTRKPFDKRTLRQPSGWPSPTTSGYI